MSKLNERHLSKQELAARDKIMIGLKHNKSGLVKRYGKDAEKIMYASAIKQAKNISEKMDNNKIREMIKSILKTPESVDEKIDNSKKYSFKDLTHFIKRSDLNNPNEDERNNAEDILVSLGFYDDEGSIDSKNFDKEYKTTDGKTLVDLENWFENNMMEEYKQGQYESLVKEVICKLKEEIKPIKEEVEYTPEDILYDYFFDGKDSNEGLAMRESEKLSKYLNKRGYNITKI